MHLPRAILVIVRLIGVTLLMWTDHGLLLTYQRAIVYQFHDRPGVARIIDKTGRRSVVHKKYRVQYR